MIQIAKPWMIRRWSRWKLRNEKQLVRILTENAHLVDLDWNEDKQPKLQPLVERYISWGAPGAWRVHWWRLACFTLGLRDTEDRNDISGQWYDEWPHDTWVDSLIFLWLRETFLPMLVNECAEYPESYEGEVSNELLLHEHEILESTFPCVLRPQKEVLFCPLPGQVRYLKRWLTKCFVDNLVIFYMFAEMGNHECTAMQLKFKD